EPVHAFVHEVEFHAIAAPLLKRRQVDRDVRGTARLEVGRQVGTRKIPAQHRSVRGPQLRSKAYEPPSVGGGRRKSPYREIVYSRPDRQSPVLGGNDRMARIG